jgi:putative transposase
MAQRTQLDDSSHPLHEAYACLPACWPTAWMAPCEASRILVNEASRIERAQYLQATLYERCAQRVDYANGYKNKTVLTRLGEVT